MKTSVGYKYSFKNVSTTGDPTRYTIEYIKIDEGYQVDIRQTWLLDTNDIPFNVIIVKRFKDKVLATVEIAIRLDTFGEIQAIVFSMMRQSLTDKRFKTK